MHAHDAQLVDRVLDNIVESMGEYLAWLAEPEAILYEGRTTPDGLRARFAELEARGLGSGISGNGSATTGGSRSGTAGVRRPRAPRGGGLGPHQAAPSVPRRLAGPDGAGRRGPEPRLDSIGDRDIRQAMRYLKRRDQRVRAAFTALDRNRGNASRTQAEAVLAGPGSTGSFSIGLQDCGLMSCAEAPEAGLEPATR